MDIDFTVIVDTREQTPSDLGVFPFERETLCTGDYSIKGLEKFVRIERKSLQDLVQCVGRERKRFEREIIRLKGFSHKAILVEAAWPDIHFPKWRGDIKPKQVIHSLLRWQMDGIPVILAGGRPESCLMLQRILYLCAKEYYNAGKSLSTKKDKK